MFHHNTPYFLSALEITRDSKTVLFYRNFDRFSGGHLKVWDYFTHVLHSPNHVPFIYFYSNPTVWDASNPWKGIDPTLIVSSPIAHPDAIFIDGLDWQTLDPISRQKSPIPIINLVQHIRHADPDNLRHPFLKCKAIRICVSEEVKVSLLKTGWVNGPLFAIPNGIDLSALSPSMNCPQKDVDILIAALKEPNFGYALKHHLETSGQKIQVLTAQRPRSEYLQQVARAKITIFLPNRQEGEGFYLPALEGMALGTLVICPDCVGNRSFCLPGYNCFRPGYNLESILEDVDQANRLSETQLGQMLTHARQTAMNHSLHQERQAFWEILNQIDQLWSADAIV